MGSDLLGTTIEGNTSLGWQRRFQGDVMETGSVFLSSLAIYCWEQLTSDWTTRKGNNGQGDAMETGSDFSALFSNLLLGTPYWPAVLFMT